MARIRTIKPELPQSESMGRVSRDARLCFILLWTLADDEGRLRGNSRMLASLLFPYDDDAKDLIQGWLNELSKEGCIVAYTHESDSYVQIHKWLKHQKIDKPSPSKIPAPLSGSESPREDSRILPVGPKDLDLGSGPKDLVPKEGSGSAAAKPTPTSKGSRLPADWSLPNEWATWAITDKPGYPVILEAAKFRDYWLSKTGKDATKADWFATWRNWVRNTRSAAGQFLTTTQRIQQNNDKVFGDFLADSGVIEHDPN